MTLSTLKLKAEVAEIVQKKVWMELRDAVKADTNANLVYGTSWKHPLFAAASTHPKLKALYDEWESYCDKAYEARMAVMLAEADAKDEEPNICPSCGETIDDGNYKHCIECRMVFVREEGF